MSAKWWRSTLHYFTLILDFSFPLKPRAANATALYSFPPSFLPWTPVDLQESMFLPISLYLLLDSLPSVGVTEGLSCVIFRAIVARKTPNLALPSLQHSVQQPKNGQTCSFFHCLPMKWRFFPPLKKATSWEFVVHLGP